ncbi:hypothetical protein GW17_00055387 [Ensete ventricosum]|nr:hypothetical protein GW17_00055387 [Ensete ventricosum]
MGEALKGNSYLDIEGELRLVDERKRQLGAHNATKESEALAMKELGINRSCLCVQDDRQPDHGLREGEAHMLLRRS